MSTRISNHFRSNVVGYVAVFIALSGTASALDGPLGGQNKVGSSDIIDGEVYSQDIKAAAVSGAKVLDGSLTGADVTNESLTNADILDGTILGGDIANGTVGTNDIGDGQVQGLDVTNESLTNADILDGTILGGDIANGTVGTNDIGDGQVQGLDVTNGTITGADIDEAQVSGLDRCQAGVTIRFGAICTGSDGSARNWGNAAIYCGGFGLRLPTLSEAMTLGANHNVQGVLDGEHFWTDEFYDFNTDGFVAEVVTVSENGLYSLTSSASDLAETVCVTEPSN